MYKSLLRGFKKEWAEWCHCNRIDKCYTVKSAVHIKCEEQEGGKLRGNHYVTRLYYYKHKRADKRDGDNTQEWGLDFSNSTTLFTLPPLLQFASVCFSLLALLHRPPPPPLFPLYCLKHTPELRALIIFITRQPQLSKFRNNG